MGSSQARIRTASVPTLVRDLDRLFMVPGRWLGADYVGNAFRKPVLHISLPAG